MDSTIDPTLQLPADDVAAIDELGRTYQAFRAELGKIIIGQDLVIEQLAICLFARGHALLMGVPGLAKTLLVSSVAQTFDLSFNRIQFTPDLMPADITGTDIIQESGVGGRREFEFIKGPVFANIVLADEINRAPAKTQSAMLEAMQENKVTVLGHTYPLQPPFFVLATQNPIEQEGTYPLPEAQQDRFMFFLWVDYPELEEEYEVLNRTTGNRKTTLESLMDGAEIQAIQRLVRDIPISEALTRYAARIVRCSRDRRGQEGEAAVPEFVRKYLQWGAGPRAGQYLILGAKAQAFMQGHTHVAAEDIRAVAQPVLRHRIIVNFAAQADRITSENLIEMILQEVTE